MIKNNEILFLEDLLIELKNKHNSEIENEITKWCETEDEAIEFERTRREKEIKLQSIILRLKKGV